MQTITEEEFFERFMKISHELTYAEVRMLYLLITEPYLVELSQQKFAEIIQAHRRTINIGLKKLKKLNYINDSFSVAKEVVSKKLEIGNSTILKHEKETAKKVILNSFENYYSINQKNFIINEDFYSFILGDIKLPYNYKHNKSFVTEIIREKYPEVSFYFELKKSSYKDFSHYYIISTVNYAIKRAKKIRVFRIKIENLLQKIYNNFSIEEEEVLKVIKSAFPKIRLTNKHISIRKPYGEWDESF